MKKAILSSVVLGLTLSGCGGGGSTGSNDGAALTTISGSVADGYLSGAVVCLDSNNNSICDAGEPRATTGSDGSYSFQVADASGVLLVEVSPTVIDQDTGLEVGGNGYILKAAVTNQSFISPITTMIQANIDNGMAYDAALEKVSADLGVPVIDKEKILSDFIATQAGEPDFALKESLHKKAVLAATIARERVREYYTQPDSILTPEGRSEALNKILTEIANIAPTISTSAESAEDISLLRLTDAFNAMKSENPTAFTSTFSKSSGDVWYSGCADEFPASLPGYQFGYYRYSFLDSGMLKAEHYYFRNQAGSNEDALTVCESRSKEGYSNTMLMFGYEFDKPLSEASDTFITLSYKKANDSTLTHDIPSYLKARKVGDYLCFGQDEGSYTDVTLDSTMIDTVDKTLYSALKTMRLSAKTMAYDAFNGDVVLEAIDHCLTRN